MLLIYSSSCNKDFPFNDDPSFRLTFSHDTVLFDTVFTTVGTITKAIKVFNKSNRDVNISRVVLADQTQSNYRINVDGMSGTVFSDVLLRAKDSMWVFVEATIDPTNQNTPLIVQDSILFYTNNNEQKIQLVAFGQDAYFHYPTVPASENFPVAYSTVSGVWSNDKPHVIYGFAFVPNDSILIIPSGTKVYMHHNANLVVLKDASLKIYGSLGDEVVFQSDRLDYYYKDLPGMWGRIWLSAGSKDNEINYTIIKNGRVGVHVDTLGNSSNPTLTMTNTIIKNMSAAGLFAQGSSVVAYNCVIANCGEFAILLNIGGKYDFRHCTIGNFWSYNSRQTPSVVLNNYYKDIHNNYQVRDLESAYFGNSIIYGNVSNEIGLDKYPYGNSIFNYHFDHTLIRTSLETNSDFFTSCIINQDPTFENTDTLYLNLKSFSPAIDKGEPSISSGIFNDIEGNPRIQGIKPDLGAYEKM